MRTTTKRQDNICLRLGHQTKSDLVALAEANEMSVAEFVRYLVREAIRENQEVIQRQKELGVHSDTSAD